MYELTKCKFSKFVFIQGLGTIGLEHWSLAGLFVRHFLDLSGGFPLSEGISFELHFFLSAIVHQSTVNFW